VSFYGGRFEDFLRECRCTLAFYRKSGKPA
jgi:hypothetical protein